MSTNDDQAPALTVYGAYHPRDCGNSAGAEHLVVSAAFVRGRLHREKGDPLCKPASKFWGLISEPGRKPTCKRCLEIAARHGLQDFSVAGVGTDSKAEQEP